MTDANTLAMLEAVARGELAPDEAARRMDAHGRTDLGFANVDLGRLCRRGRAEAIYCEGKTPTQIVAIARALLDAGQNALLTRLNPAAATEVMAPFGDAACDYDTAARLGRIVVAPAPRKAGTVGVLCAGTTDLPVAEEAARTAEFYGSPVERFNDVGVAGLHRLLGRLEEIRRARVLIVVAGMEGALPSVVAGLVRAPIVAVPTSVGYGSGAGGHAALLAMLNSCAPGIAVTNIDNGFGAGYYADVLNGL